MKKNNSIISLFVLFIAFSCTSEDKILSVGERIEQIVAESDNPAQDGTPSLEDLASAGIRNATGNQASYERAIALAIPAPTTLTELQNIVNNVNDNVGGFGDNDTLEWYDEFDVDGSPSSTHWTYDIGTGQSGWGNNEVQYYTQRPDNVSVANGMLTISAKKENFEGANYTSARIKTQGKYSFTYGKVEVRAKLPASAGTWPAIWMLGANFNTVGWPACGEIDIMEQKGWDKNTISAALHNLSSSGNTENTKETLVTGSTTDFHIYAVNWTAEKIEFSVDGVVFYTYNPEVKTNENWPYTASQFIILNLAMGGSLGGDIPTDFTESKMEIDYVRIYRKKTS